MHRGRRCSFSKETGSVAKQETVFAGWPTPWGRLEGCPGSRVQKQVSKLAAATTTSTSAALIPLNSISQRVLIHTAAGEEGKKKEKSNILLKPPKVQMPITQPHRLWHKACIVHVGCRLSWECLWWILTVSWPEVTWGSPLPPPRRPAPPKASLFTSPQREM